LGIYLFAISHGGTISIFMFHFRCNFLMNNAIEKILCLTCRREKFLVVAAVRFMRTIISRNVSNLVLQSAQWLKWYRIYIALLSTFLHDKTSLYWWINSPDESKWWMNKLKTSWLWSWTWFQYHMLKNLSYGVYFFLIVNAILNPIFMQAGLCIGILLVNIPIRLYHRAYQSQI